MDRAKLSKYLFALYILAFTACSDGEKVDELFDVGGSSDTIGNSAFEFTPSSYDFGAVLANSGNSNYVITAKNVASDSVSVTDVEGDNTHFAIQSTTCSGPIGPQGECTITVRFQPLAIGEFGTTVRIKYSYGGNDFQASMGVEGRGVGSLAFSGLDSIDQVQTRSLRLNWTHDASAANYFVFEIVGGIPNLITSVSAPTDNYTITGLSPNTAYEYRVRAQDFFGSLETNTNDISVSTLATPSLTDLTNLVYDANEQITGNLISLDVNNTITGDDSFMSYTCTFDRVIDNSVAAGSNCSNLPGTVDTTNLASAGQIGWTPSGTQSIGTYELQFTGSMGVDSDTEIVSINVGSNYTITNLELDFEASFSQIFTQGTNTPLDTSWSNILSTGPYVGGTATLNNFDGTAASGWNGSTAASDLHRLVFDGLNDLLNIGTGINSNANIYVQTWVQLGDTSTGGQTLFSNGSYDGNGLSVRQSTADPDSLQLVVGSGTGDSHDTEVLANAPVAYYRFDDLGGTLTNYGSLGAAVDGAVSASMGVAGLATDTSPNDAASFNGSTHNVLVPNNASINTSNHNLRSIEVYFRVEGSTAPQQTVYEEGGSGNGFRIYVEGGNVICQAWSDNQGWGSTGTNGVKYISSPISLNTDYYVALTFDQPSDELKCFVNGVQVGSTVNNIGTMNNHGGDISIGRTGDSTYDTTGAVGSAGNYFQGVIDELAIYNSVLSPASIAANYNPTSMRSCTSSKNLKEGVWYLIGTYYDGSTARLYINGNEECNFAISTGYSPPAAAFRFGADATPANYLEGSLGHMAIYSDLPTADPVNDPLNFYNATYEKYLVQPSEISNLTLWFDPQVGVTYDGSNRVSIWQDQSGNNYHGDQSTLAEQPTYVASSDLNGRPGIRFSGGAQYLPIRDLNYSAVGSLAGVTIFAVVNGDGDGHIVSFDRSAVYRLEVESGGIGWQTTDDDGSIHDLNEATSVTDGSPHIVVVRYNPVTGFKDIIIDGVFRQQNVAGHGAGDNLAGGAELPRFGYIGVGSEASTFDSSPSPAEYFDGDMGDVIKYSRALSDSELFQIENYLKVKYGFSY